MSTMTTKAQRAQAGAVTAAVTGATHTATLQVHVRFFAGAAEAAGTPSESVDLPAGATLDDLRAQLLDQHPGAARVLEISSFLVDDVVRDDHAAPLGAHGSVRVDVLPPFAGG